jgi:flagellar FliL protein
MSESEQEKPVAESPAKKKGGLKKIILIVAVVALLGGAGGGFYFWRSSVAAAAAAGEDNQKKASNKKSQSKKDPEADTSDGETTETGKPAKQSNSLKNSIPNDEDVKKVIDLPPFIVNLADTEQARYLRMTVSIGIGGEGGENEKPNQLFLTRVRNAMLAVLSDKKSEEILTIEGKTKLRKELLGAAQAASEDPEVLSIYITDFIVQL